MFILTVHKKPAVNFRLAIYLHVPNTCFMKYHAGQVVTLLNTDYKPAGRAVICHYEQSSEKYEVDFIYPDKEKADKISVPEERLILVSDSLPH